ncbi:MAG: Asp-tRNA(Asn)/Glu-tRNA(Gln) amidotransferase subunit GatB [Microscillaceae bacterium]|jgi:aspartyl-tRNA(Asn)/glutamyl-tRNA(Gln) amidotransferase subunit B|nr:Asp-tRNA(Asn)/Glu-tRNA(Gln) amidotransferase subunit GatB [Microscillaceae bacterium]
MNNLLEKYEIVIGLEVHAQLQTQTKIFTADSTEYGGAPNTHISVITLAHPGTLPRVSREVIEYAVKMGLACGSSITPYNVFARKNYFYPDLPKGYQVTQDKDPICVGGKVSFKLKNGELHHIRLHHIHLEEDAGKSLHTNDSDDTLLDYNRAGVPLIEIVSEPDMRSSEEAYYYMQEIQRIVRYLDICDGNMEEGSLRCDANVSVRLRGASQLGTRVEIKNMNSFRFLQKAIDYEAQRQMELIEKDEKAQIIQETRTFDPNTGKTYGMRVKESMNDYRYFPEPDLTPVVISESWLAQIKAQMPTLPWEWQQKLKNQYGLSEYDAGVLTDSRQVVEFFAAVCQFTTQFKAVANWINGEIKAYLNDKSLEMSQLPISAQQLADLIELIAQNQVSNSVASQKILPQLLNEPHRGALEIAQTYNWLLENNANALQQAVNEVVAQFPDKVKEYQKGKKGLQGMFMGEIMKKTQGKADPKLANQLLIKALAEA